MPEAATLSIALPQGRSARIGLISDTHGLLRREALVALEGVDAIIHAGDVGQAAILDTLRQAAPLLAVRGNIDSGLLAKLPERAVLCVGTLSILVLHDLAQLLEDPAAAGYRVVVSGHSHQPAITARDDVLYINPGSAGPRRFRLPVSVALLSYDGERPSAQLLPLAVAPSR
jgi:uncharacterized protein